MNEILFLRPVFKERIWGGKRLSTEFGYEIPYERTGECWAISAHPNGASVITEGPYAGQTLDRVYQSDKSLFNHLSSERFPLLTKILDANDDLSVQVHPDDTYGLLHHGDLGKTECWYILSAEPHATIVYGHRAQTKEALESMIHEDRWKELLIEKEVKQGDFIYVPSGTVHAIGKGIMILESQQSSDTTYRLYDYHRKDASGKERELHLKASIDVTRTPHVDPVLDIQVSHLGHATLTTYVENAFFTVQKWDIDGELHIPTDHFKLMSVIDGRGSVNGKKIQKGDHFIVTAHAKDLNFEGRLSMICSYV